MIERLLIEMVLVVLSQDLNLAAQVVIRALDELEFTHLAMAL